MRYVPRRAKVVYVLAVRQVKQGTETTRFRTDSTPHPYHVNMFICKPLDYIQ